MVIVLLKHVAPEGDFIMKLKDRFLLLVVAVALAVSMFIGLAVIVDNVNAAPMRPAAAIRPPVAIMSESVNTGV